MARLIFTNKSNTVIVVAVGDESYSLFPSQIQCVPVPDGTAQFSVCTGGRSYINYFIKSAGIISKRHFIAVTDFRLTAYNECEIHLYSQTKKGVYMDEYEFIIPRCENAELTALGYSVKDGDSFIRELEKSSRKGKRAIFLFDLLDILGNAFVGILILVIPFLLIWLFKDIELAWDICSVAFIPIFAIIVVINRFFDKLRKILWENGKQFFFRKKLFKGYRSYFDSEYIRSVAESKR